MPARGPARSSARGSTEEERLSILTIGHSRHPLDHFLGLLRQHGCQALADVRSHPVSRFAPQFNRRTLAAAVERGGIAYLFLGRELGGRPRGEEFQDPEGHVLYGRVAAAPFFREGLERVLGAMRTHRIALLCAEEDPAHCHRRLLVGRVLAEHGVALEHIRGDGRLEGETGLPGLPSGADAGQGSLFDPRGNTAWRSVRALRT